ncbi:MAG: SPOR domain-containing protein [Ignavibacteriales bacterium]|nr:SPOR domain-containing protein [Ignavibacteriales bacterium]
MTIQRMVDILLLQSLALAVALSQTPGGQPDIQRRLELIDRGQAEAVKAELPTLMTNFQNHPGVLYLQAVLMSDGSEAVKTYQSIVDNFPTSEWADDALFRLYQYYYSIGLYKTADQKLEQLKKDYPFSTYASDQALAEEPKTVTAEAPVVVAQPAKVEKFTTIYTVQAGTFSVLQNAEELKSRFERDGYTSTIFTLVNNGRKFHKVWVGEFQKQDEAKRFSGEIKKKYNLDSIVVTR